MLSIQSPLRGIVSPFGNRASVAALSAYAVLGSEPQLVFDSSAGFFRKAGAATTFSGLVTFARASEATYVDSSGVLQTAASGVARTDHHRWNGSAWVKVGRLESEARTNLITQSNDFTNASWASFASNTGTLAHDAQGPDGVVTSALTLVDSNAGGTGAVYLTSPGVTVANSTAYTLSIFAKAGGESWLYLEPRNFTTPGNVQTFFNLSAATVGTVGTGISASIVSLENGWCRCSITFTTDVSDTNGAFRVGVSDGDSDSTVSLDGTSSILIYGAQFELGSVPSSYIPTNGSTVTRAAETLTIAGADMPYSATAMSFAVSGEMDYADTNAVQEAFFYEWSINTSNRLDIRLNTSAARTGQVQFYQVVSGVSEIISSATDYYSPGQNVAYNLAVRNGSIFLNGALHGVALTEDTTPTSLVDLSATTFRLGSKYMGSMPKLRAWNIDLTDAGIVEASS